MYLVINTDLKAIPAVKAKRHKKQRCLKTLCSHIQEQSSKSLLNEVIKEKNGTSVPCVSH